MSTGAGLDQFLTDLQAVLRAAWGDDWGHLAEEIPSKDVINDLPMPVIVSKLNSRRPSTERKSPKPRNMGTDIDQTRQGLIEVSYMWYDVDLEFCVYNKTHAGAKEVAEGLEEILLNFAGYFKSRGVDEIRFAEERPPTVEDQRRLDLPARHLHYQLRLQKVFRVHASVIESIKAKVEVAAEPPEGGL